MTNKDDEKKPDATEAKDETTKATERRAAAPSGKPASKPPVEDEDDEDDDDDEDEDEDEDEDDEDEDEEREAKPARSASRRPAGARSDRPTTRSTSPRAASSGDDWLPDWAPWAVMGGLIFVGLLGALGVFSSKKPAVTADEASAATTTTTATTKTTAATAKGSAAAMDQEAIEASHLLVQYQGSARAAATVTRTKDEAKKRAEEAAARAKKGDDFAKLVGEYSDEPNAAARGGKLGRFTRRSMVPAFSKAAFELKPGQISGVVETPFGFHVIKRTQ